MKTLTLRGLALLFVLVPLIVRAAPPVNDKFVNATVLNGRTVTLHNQNGSAATAEPLDPYIGGFKLTKTVWYRFDALFTVNKNHVIVTHPFVGLRLGVFAMVDPDGGQGTLTEVTEKVVVAAGTDAVTFATAAGRRYYLCVEAAGSFDLTLQQPGQDNDFFADATVLTGNQGTVTGTTVNCTNDASDFPTAATISTLFNGVWYQWTPTVTAQVAIDTNFSFVSGNSGEYYDTKLYVYTGTTLANLVEVAHDDDGGVNYNSRVSFAAVAGTTYTIWVGGFSSSNPSAFNLEYFPETSPGDYEVVAPSTTLSEAQGPVHVEIRRHFAGFAISPAVTASTTDGSATGGTDYVAIPPTVLTFTTNTESAFLNTVTLKTLADNVQEFDENFNLNLTSPTLGTTIDTGSTAVTFYIKNDPLPVIPGFLTTAVSVKETAGSLIIPVQRLSTVGQVDFTIGNTTAGIDTARQGIDYSVPNGPYEMAPGVGLVLVSVQIVDNARATGDKTFTLTIIPTDHDSQIHDGVSQIIVTITDTDQSAPQPAHFAAMLDSGIGLGASVDVKVTAAGTLTGRLIMNRATYAFTGKLDASGAFTVTVGPPGATRQLTLRLVNGTSSTYAVTLRDNDLGTTASALAYGTSFTATAPCPQAAPYTYYTGPSGGLIVLGTGSLKVDVLGNATLNGRLFDGAPVIASGAVDANGNVSVAATLYAGQGRFAVGGALPVLIGDSGATHVRVVRPGSANQTVALPPVDDLVTNYVVLYNAPPPGHRVLTAFDPAGAGKAVLQNAGYGMPTAQPISVTTGNVVSLAGSLPFPVPTLKVTIVPATGFFSGSVVPPGAPGPQAFTGYMLQLTSSGGAAVGIFLNPATPTVVGAVVLESP